jgi:hypothetical protein
VCRAQAGSLQTLSDQMTAEGYDVQFTLLSDVNATDYSSRVTVPIFRDPSGSRDAWEEMSPTSAKHDTFVFSRQGMRTLYRPASAGLTTWSADVRAAVEALGK